MSLTELSKEELLAEIEQLRQKNSDLSTEIGDLELLLEMTTEHSDTMGAELQDRAEEAVRESERRFRMITEATPVPVIITQMSSQTVLFGNPLAGPLFGFKTTEALLGSQLIDFFCDPKEHQTLLHQLAQENAVDNYELKLKKLDNSQFWVSMSLRLLDYNDEPAILSSLHDITERKEAAQALQKALDDLQQVDKMKDEFLANTSHELRTPLNGIIGLAESLIEGVTGPLPEDTKHNLDMIVTSGRRLANLVNDILDFAKLRHQELHLQKTPVDVCALTEVVLSLSKPLAAKKEIKLFNNIPIDVPLVEADENRVQQILHNLIGNAIKFTEKGHIKISAESLTAKNWPKSNGHPPSTPTLNAEQEWLAIIVSDTGIGIPKDKFDRIFASFEQADGSTSRNYGGTGLGLSVSKQLVELHGGQIWVESEVKQGSQFTFTLPLSDQKRDKTSVSPQRRPRSRSSEISTVRHPATLKAAKLPIVAANDNSDLTPNLTPQLTSDGSHFNILIVDDEPVNLQVLANYLLLENYSITQANNGLHALEILEGGHKFDLMVLDVMMPQMSGYEVCQKVRQKYPAHELPIMLLTAKNQVNDLVTGFDVGANDYLTKPILKEELLSRIKTHLRVGRLTNAYARFVPHEFLKFLGRETIIDVQLGDQIQQEMTILFSDIRSFTTLSETMSPQENFNFINAYLNRVSPIIRKHQGFIDKYIGDAIMALFTGQANNALQASIEMHHEVAHYNQKRQKQNYQPISIGVGLHTGRVMLGTVGETQRMEGTVISDAVNLSARLEGLTKLYGAGIVISDNTLFGLDRPNQYNFRFLDKVKVKGKKDPVSVFEILDGNPQEVVDLKLKTRTDFEMALLHYHSQEFKDAQVHFENVLEVDATDRAARLYLKRVKQFIEYGVPVDWEGIEALTDK